jgi:hypothetical protein
MVKGQRPHLLLQQHADQYYYKPFPKINQNF